MYTSTKANWHPTDIILQQTQRLQDILEGHLLVSAVRFHLCASDSKVFDYNSLSQEDCEALEADDNWKGLCDGLQKSTSVIKLGTEFSQKCLHSLRLH